MNESRISDEYLEKLEDTLRQRHETVTTVESLTAGMIASRLADIPGCSDVLKQAYVTYCDEAKASMVGVKEETLRRYTAVSAQTAAQMAEGGAGKAGAAACISATGYAGPPAGPGDNSAGLVYLGCFYHGKTVTREHHYKGSRNEVRRQAMEDSIELLAELLYH